jgi:ectoine hydroxylase-related dioxygenase (phytanoyl-CoA dioxygenase family)
MTTGTIRITEAQQRQFAEEGYMVLESAIDRELLGLLEIELEQSIAAINARMDELGSDVDGLNQRDKRYFIGNLHLTQPDLKRFLFSELMADVCRATLGDDVWHFWNQFVVKCGEVGATFGWHQDSGYLAKQKTSAHKPYLTCWCPLDDVDERNGTIYVLPFSRMPSREVIDHRYEGSGTELIGYFGDDPGDPIIVPAGSIVAFSTTLLHRSGPNTTDRPRRVYVCQYSAEPIMLDVEPPRPWLCADPFLVGGQRLPGIQALPR